METIQLSHKALVAKIIQVRHDNEDVEGDLVGIFQHIVLDSGFANLDDAVVLSWFPDAVLAEVLQWLEGRAAEDAAAVIEEEEI